MAAMYLDLQKGESLEKFIPRYETAGPGKGEAFLKEATSEEPLKVKRNAFLNDIFEYISDRRFKNEGRTFTEWISARTLIVQPEDRELLKNLPHTPEQISIPSPTQELAVPTGVSGRSSPSEILEISKAFPVTEISKTPTPKTEQETTVPKNERYISEIPKGDRSGVTRSFRKIPKALKSKANKLLKILAGAVLPTRANRLKREAKAQERGGHSGSK
jgi:hypothetical protein